MQSNKASPSIACNRSESSNNTMTQPLSFRDLHQAGKPFILANAWDAGSAKVLAALGAKAIASTSGGHAFTLGLKDMGHISREQSLDHCQALIEATPLPVSGDLENGYGDSPVEVAETIRLAAEAGLAGGCIEDVILPSMAAYPFTDAVARIEAAADAAKAAQKATGDFVLTARADGIMNGVYDSKEAIRRIKAFEQVGADVIYVPLPPSFDTLARICKAVELPVNALAAGSFVERPIRDYANAGVARISLGSSLARLTHATLIASAQQLFGEGDFSSLAGGISGSEVEALFGA